MDTSSAVRKWFVNFLFPATVHPENRQQPIDHGDPKRVTVPKDAFGFMLSSHVTATVTENGKSFELVGGHQDDGIKYFVAGELYSIDDPPKGISPSRVHELKGLGYQRLIKVPRGDIYPFREDYVLLET